MESVFKKIKTKYHLADAVQWMLNLHLTLIFLVAVFPHTFKYAFVIGGGVLVIQIIISLFRAKFVSVFVETTALFLGFAMLFFPYGLQLPLLVILEIVLISDFRNFKHP